MKTKKLMQQLACINLLAFTLTGCGSIAIDTTISDKTLFKCESQRLTLNETAIIVMDYQNRYNSYYGNLGMKDFWDEKINGMDFSENLRDSAIKEEVCTLMILNCMADDSGVTLSQEDTDSCRKAADEYYSSLTQQEIDYLSTDTDIISSLYEKYLLADRMISQLSPEREVSDNDKRVISARIIGSDNKTEINDAKDKIDNGMDFLTAAEDYSKLPQVEYQISRGMLNSKVEEASFLLCNNEVSSVIEAGDWYYIVQCVNDFDEQLTESGETEILKRIKYSEWAPYVVSDASKYTVAVDESTWNKINMSYNSKIGNTGFFTIYDKYLNFRTGKD